MSKHVTDLQTDPVCRGEEVNCCCCSSTQSLVAKWTEKSSESLPGVCEGAKYENLIPNPQDPILG